MTALRREGADTVRRRQPWSLPLEDRVLHAAAYWHTNLTLRQLAPLFGSCHVPLFLAAALLEASPADETAGRANAGNMECGAAFPANCEALEVVAQAGQLLQSDGLGHAEGHH